MGSSTDLDARNNEVRSIPVNGHWPRVRSGPKSAPEPDIPPYLDSAAGGFNLLGELAGWNSAERSSDRARSRRNSVVKSRDTRLLSRREFNERCVALSSLVTLSGALALDAATAVALTGAARTVKFRDGTIVPAIGQGSWHIGQGRHPAAHEEEALRTGLSLGMT